MSLDVQGSHQVSSQKPLMPQKSQVAVKLKQNPLPDSEEDLRNPFEADKLELSLNSFKEERALLKSKEQNHVQTRSSLDIIRNNLLRAESLLYQVMATGAFDQDSLEAVQRRIARELSGVDVHFKKVDLPGLTARDVPQQLREPEKIELESYSDVKQLSEDIKSASEKVDRVESELQNSSEDDVRVGKLLEVAEQNTAAAISNYDPSDIFKRAENVSQALKQQHPAMLDAHLPINQQAVVDLLA